MSEDKTEESYKSFAEIKAARSRQHRQERREYLEKQSRTYKAQQFNEQMKKERIEQKIVLLGAFQGEKGAKALQLLDKLFGYNKCVFHENPQINAKLQGLQQASIIIHDILNEEI